MIIPPLNWPSKSATINITMKVSLKNAVAMSDFSTDLPPGCNAPAIRILKSEARNLVQRRYMLHF